MLAHLFTDEKFIDSAHESFEGVAPGESRYFVLDPPAKLKFIRQFQPEPVPVATMLDSIFLESLKSYDVVFLHALNDHARAVVDAASDDVNFCWIGWGYDYYDLISSSDERLLPLTRQANGRLTTSRPASRNLQLIVRKFARAIRRLPTLSARMAMDRSLRHAAPGTTGEMSMFRKIRSFAPVLMQEGESILRKHDLSFSLRSWNYSIQDTIDAFPSRTGDHASDAIIVGNSATPESNHIDAFEHLARIGFSGVVICPLSYGDGDYAKLVIGEGTALFGSRFKPLTSFMSIQHYQVVIAEARYLYMNHRRQQGLGNILMALYSGTAVIMRKENPLFPVMEELGLPVVDADSFDLTEDIAPKDLDRTRNAIVSFFGRDNQLRRTTALIDACRADREVKGHGTNSVATFRGLS